jgi:hypothetical protein
VVRTRLIATPNLAADMSVPRICDACAVAVEGVVRYLTMMRSVKFASAAETTAGDASINPIRSENPEALLIVRRVINLPDGLVEPGDPAEAG